VAVRVDEVGFCSDFVVALLKDSANKEMSIKSEESHMGVVTDHEVWRSLLRFL